MIQIQNKFYSCIETRIQSQGEMYARFHLGTFFRGQALTVANALRRTLLGELPSLVVTHVQIDGVGHEFSTIPGIQESVLDILLNLKRLTFTLSNQNFDVFENSSLKTKVFLKIRGPAKVTAADLKLPPHISCVWPNQSIATLSSNAELACILELALVHPKQKISLESDKNNKFLSPSLFPKAKLLLSKKQTFFGIKSKAFNSVSKNGSFVTKEQDSFVSNKLSFLEAEGMEPNGKSVPIDRSGLDEINKKIFYLDHTKSPVRKVNYVIYELDSKKDSEYVALEILTDGSIEPKQALRFAFKQLTKLFYEFTQLSKQTLSTK